MNILWQTTKAMHMSILRPVYANYYIRFMKIITSSFVGVVNVKGERSECEVGSYFFLKASLIGKSQLENFIAEVSQIAVFY